MPPHPLFNFEIQKYESEPKFNGVYSRFNYCIACDKYRKFKNTKISYTFKNTLGLSIVCSKSANEYKKYLKKDESIEILKILGLITNTEEYQKIYNHD